MSKLYTIKFYSKKDGSTKLVKHDLIEKYEYDKKQAFKTGRVELVRIARSDYVDYWNYINNCDEIQEAIKDIIVNKNNNYYHDTTTYLFKVFSKKVKK